MPPSHRHHVAAAGLLVLLLALAGCSVSVSLSSPTPAHSPSAADGVTVTVIDVVDGDTVDVRYANGSTDTVRLLGVDTPEVHVEVDPAEFEGIPDTDAGRDWLDRWGDEASTFVQERVANERVRVVVDPRADRRGDYGRLLAYVYDDGDLLNRALLSRGYARLYDTTFSRRDDFAAAEIEARSAGRGLWGFGSNRSTAGG